MFKDITQNHLRLFRHTVKEDGLRQLALEGMFDGRRPIGWQGKRHLDDLALAVGKVLQGELCHLAQEIMITSIYILNDG